MKTTHILKVIGFGLKIDPHSLRNLNHEQVRKYLTILVRDLRSKRTIIEVPVFSTYDKFNKRFIDTLYNGYMHKTIKVNYEGNKPPYVLKTVNGKRILKFRNVIEKKIRKAFHGSEKIINV